MKKYIFHIGKATIAILTVIVVISVFFWGIITKYVLPIPKETNTHSEFTLLSHTLAKDILSTSDFSDKDNCKGEIPCNETSCVEGQECRMGKCVCREHLIPASENPSYCVECNVASDCPASCQQCIHHTCTPSHCCTEEEIICGQNKCCSKEELCCNNECLKPCHFKGTTGRRSEQCDCLCKTHKGFKLISKDGVCLCRDGLVKVPDGESCVQCNTDVDCAGRGDCMVCNELHVCTHCNTAPNN